MGAPFSGSILAALQHTPVGYAVLSVLLKGGQAYVEGKGKRHNNPKV